MVTIDSSTTGGTPAHNRYHNQPAMHRSFLRNVTIVVQWSCVGIVLVWCVMTNTPRTRRSSNYDSDSYSSSIGTGDIVKTGLNLRVDERSIGGSGNDVLDWSSTSIRDNNTSEKGKDKDKDKDKDSNDQCRFYLGESAIPYGGLGLFTVIDIAKGNEAQSMPDICIYVADTPLERTAFETHSWAKDVFFGQFEGRNPRGACEGIATLVNSMPDGKQDVRTSKLTGFTQHTNAGLNRYKDPGAGASTHYYGISSKAERDIPAGSELTINYGDWEYDANIEYVAPMRSVDWIQKHGMCIDNIEIKNATDKSMGRGAFAKRSLPQGTIIAPAPIQAFPSRKAFAQRIPEALFVNYCFEIQGTAISRNTGSNDSILLFPYGPGVNLINHGNSSVANVKIEWSNHYMSHTNWLHLPEDQFWQMYYPGAIIMDIVAIRDIEVGEELFMDYGTEWEAAWNEHVHNWKPPPKKHQYSYTQDMNRTEPFRTVEEQKKKPYPPNLHTVCYTSNWKRDEYTIMKYKPIKSGILIDNFSEGLVYCDILSRTEVYNNKLQQLVSVYNVSLNFNYMDPDAVDKGLYIDTHVPHNAISFVDKPYRSDLHLRKAFRHPIGLPKSLIPLHWLVPATTTRR